MKKVLLVMLVAGFVACNNSSEKKEGEGTDTTTQVQPAAQPATQDTMPAAPAVADTSATKK